jgi:hypothetical protein
MIEGKRAPFALRSKAKEAPNDLIARALIKYAIKSSFGVSFAFLALAIIIKIPRH